MSVSTTCKLPNHECTGRTYYKRLFGTAPPSHKTMTSPGITYIATALMWIKPYPNTCCIRKQMDFARQDKNHIHVMTSSSTKVI